MPGSVRSSPLFTEYSQPTASNPRATYGQGGVAPSSHSDQNYLTFLSPCDSLPSLNLSKDYKLPFAIIYPACLHAGVRE